MHLCTSFSYFVNFIKRWLFFDFLKKFIYLRFFVYFNNCRLHDSWAFILFDKTCCFYIAKTFRLFDLLYLIHKREWSLSFFNFIYIRYDLSMLISFLLYIASAIGGQMMWKVEASFYCLFPPLSEVKCFES